MQEKTTGIARIKEGEDEQVIDLTKIDGNKFNVLVPTEKVKMLSPYHMARMQIVHLSSSPDDQHVFKVGSRKKGDKWEDQLSLSKVGLLMLADAAGIIWNTPECRRIDNMNDRNYVAYQAVGGIRLPDGRFRAYKATKEIDMEVIEEEIRIAQEEKGAKNKLPQEEIEQNIRKEVVQFRKHKSARCETGAYNRVIRGLLSLKNTFTPTELAKPFIVPRIDFAPDYSDPEIKQTMRLAMQAMIEDDFGDRKNITPEMRQAEQRYEAMKKSLPSPEWKEAESASEECQEAEFIEEDGEQEEAGRFCSLLGCGVEISEEQFASSMEKYDRPLCDGCASELENAQ